MLDTVVVGGVAIVVMCIVSYAVSSVVLCFKYGSPETETEWHMSEPTTTVVDDGNPRPYMRYTGEKIITTIYVVLFIIAMVAICYGVGRIVKALL